MEWVLQVVDEIDDAIGAARHSWAGVHAEAGLLWGCTLTVAAGLAIIASRTGFL